ncbi:YqeB family protein [Oceanobacillus jeddahense]|uniref:ABC transporter permease n=1 Tax=Oceanobacillus jeddahense TaxID=1462527 RepID=A0ABY5JNW5_9BACI|nr:ABC transporter permease [Oceanobacillus jeddahense]UUI02001.1 ABC transporter permease [Oceanobacillus jeddahense]
MQNETVLGLSKLDKAIIIIGGPLLGAIIGWFIQIISSWLVKIPFVPFGPFFEWIVSWNSSWVSIIGVIVGLIAGILFVFYAFSESLKMTITDQKVTMKRYDQEVTLQKRDISAIYMDRKEIVVLGQKGEELYRSQTDVKQPKIEAAFLEHRFPWKDQDPYQADYQRWVPEHSDFPASVNSLLLAREKALKEDDEKEAAILRKDLAAEGAVIRDEDKRQYVRVIRG